MARRTLSIVIFFATVALWLGTIPTLAQTRVFVAAQGSDANPCTFALPCRTFQHAHDIVAASGEIDVLDPAGYGSVTITKSISIQGHGFAGISVASGGTGITINAGATDIVNLNGLIADGVGVGAIGIGFNTGGTLTVNNCITHHLTNAGINFSPTTAGRLTVTNSLSFNNGSTGVGVAAIGSGAVTATVSETVVAGNGLAGFYVATSGAAPAKLMVIRSVTSHNTAGLHVLNSLATLRIAQSAVTGNGSGWLVFSGGTVLSAGDNTIEDNASNETAPPTYSLK